MDAHKNFATSLVATAPSPASSGTSLVVTAGDGSKFPAAPFNAVVWATGVQPTTANAEVVRVTAVSTDTLTITRAQESSSARSIVVGDQIANAITAKALTDVEAAAGARVARRNAAMGFTDQTWDLVSPVATLSALAPTSQKVYGSMVGLNAGDVVSNVFMALSTAGAGTTPTGIYLGLYTTAGVQLAVSANLAANSGWTGTGIKSFALSSPYTVTTAGGYYLCLLQNGTWGTTSMQPFIGGQQTKIVQSAIGSGPTFCVAQTSQATLPSPATFVGDASNYWFGWS